MADAGSGSEPLSKNELKRRQKAEKKATEKAEKEAQKAADAAAKGEPEKTDKASEEDISPNEYFKIRSAAIEELKLGPKHPYPHKFHVNISLTEFIETYSSMESGETKEEGKKYLDPKIISLKIWVLLLKGGPPFTLLNKNMVMVIIYTGNFCFS